MSKRVFISTTASRFKTLYAHSTGKDLEIQNRGLRNFSRNAPIMVVTGNQISQYDPKQHTEATLFLLDFSLTELPDFTIDQENDFLLYHISEQSDKRTHNNIINLFSNKLQGHHEASSEQPEKEWHIYKWAADIIINDEIHDKATAIINKIWPATNTQMKAGIDFFRKCFSEAPPEDCPNMINELGLKSQYDAFHTAYKSGALSSECTEALQKLVNAFYDKVLN